MPETQVTPHLHEPSIAERSCPSCGGTAVEHIYTVPEVPVHSVLLVRTREDALNFPTGTLELVHCRSCGFIFNALFDESKLNYSTEYEETQGFSETFNAFHRRLAAELIERFDLRNKDVLEIGCGKGEFLTLLCRMGENRGVGFDPAYVPERSSSNAGDNITFIQDFYSEKYAHLKADFICCKMTLEHIPDVARFIGTVRRAVGNNPTKIFFQIPDMSRVVEEVAFWDIYYEHCSYFTASALRTLFTREGFDVTKVWTDYDGQYLMIQAEPALFDLPSGDGASAAVPALPTDISGFKAALAERTASWKSGLERAAAGGKKIVLWGGGSKAVAFLTTLGIRDEVQGAVDINPYKHGTYLSKTGHLILSPQDLVSIRPDVVIIMNPIYRREIAAELTKLGLSPFITDITSGHDEMRRFA